MNGRSQINRSLTLPQRSVWWDTAMRSGEAYDEVTEAALEKWELPKRRAFLPGSRI